MVEDLAGGCLCGDLRYRITAARVEALPSTQLLGPLRSRRVEIASPREARLVMIAPIGPNLR